jgi:hypothetical protein
MFRVPFRWLAFGWFKGSTCDEKNRDYEGRSFTIRIGQFIADLTVARKEKSL